MEKGDCSHLLENKEPSHILRKALVLLEHQITKDDVQRQLKIVNQYLIVSRDGFFVKDLAQIMSLVDKLREKSKQEPLLEEPLSKLLTLCSIPPKLTRTSELLRYGADIEEYFSWLGYLLVWLTDKSRQEQVVDAFHNLFTKDYPNRRCYLTLTVRKEKTRSSKLPGIIGEMLEIVDKDIYNKLLKVLLVLLEGSTKTCEDLLKKNALNNIIARLEPTWRERYPNIKPDFPTGREELLDTETIFQILSILLDCASQDKKPLTKAPTRFTLWSLQWAFRLFSIKEGTGVERNNVLAVLLKLLDIFPDILSGNFTFAYDIASLAMSADIIFPPNWTSEVKLTPSLEDQSCMALLLMCISYLPNCLGGLKIIEECRVVLGLLKLLSNQQAIQWPQLQRCYLIGLSLNVLHKIVPSATEEFVEDGGPFTILQLLKQSQQNSKHYNYKIIFRSLEVLAHFSYHFSSVRESVAYNGGMHIILPMLEDLIKEPILTLNHQTLLGVGVFLLEHITTCEKETYDTLPLIINYMKRFTSPKPEDPIQDPRLLIIILSYFWVNVTGSEANSLYFVKMGGVYLILDIIQMGCLSVQLVALGALIDLCESVECIPYLITWRKNGQRILSLLMDIFRKENKKLGVKINAHGEIKDIQNPLMGKVQYYETYCTCNKVGGNSSIADMFVNCRPKVYCLLQILNSKQRDTVELANDFYKLYNEELSANDQITLLLAENFFALKLAEEWRELDRELEKIGLEPIPSDSATIKAVVLVTNKWGLVLKKMQHEVLTKSQLHDLDVEQKLYETLREARLADSLEALFQLKYIARCSERLFRISSNYELSTQIDKSIQYDKKNGQMHRTYMSNLSVTCKLDQSVDVGSNVCEDKDTVSEVSFLSPPSSESSHPYVDNDDSASYKSDSEYLFKIKCKSDKAFGKKDKIPKPSTSKY